jgi:hypothetical protein
MVFGLGSLGTMEIPYAIANERLPIMLAVQVAKALNQHGGGQQ